MKRDNLFKHILPAFGIALLVYAALYTSIERRRNRPGPWQVTFSASTAAAPSIIINQPVLGITNVQISFGSSSPLPAADTRKLEFGEARAVPFDVPFGQCVFLDTTFLPGTVALRLFGHEIQLLPRVLTIDKVERNWRSGETITVTGSTNPGAKPK